MKNKNSGLAVKATKAIRAAVRHVVEDCVRTGSPVVVWKNGKVARVSAENILKNARP